MLRTYAVLIVLLAVVGTAAAQVVSDAPGRVVHRRHVSGELGDVDAARDAAGTA